MRESLTGAPPPVAAVSSRSRAIFIVTALGAFMASLDLSIVNVAFPALERSFPHDSRASLAWVITGYSIVFGSLLVTAGRSADRIGRRKVFFAGLAVFSLGSALCGLAPSVSLLIAGRLIQGCGAAAMLPASLGLLLGAFPPERRSQVVALWGGVGALGCRHRPVAGRAIDLGRRVALGVLREPPGRRARLAARSSGARDSKSDEVRARPDYLGVVLVSTALAALVLGDLRGAELGLVQWAGDHQLRLGGGPRRAVPLTGPPTTLSRCWTSRCSRSRSFSVANAATLLYAMGFFAMLLGNILFLTRCGTTPSCGPGSPSRPGPFVVAAVSGPAGRAGSPGRVPARALVGIGVFRRWARLVCDAGSGSIPPTWRTGCRRR